MKLKRTDKSVFTDKEILAEIKDYEDNVVPGLTDLWKYYKVENPEIMNRKPKEVNNPDNRTPTGYGKKIVTTFTGYAWRARYCTYKVEGFPAYEKQLQETFDLTNEHIKTSKIGRNIAIFPKAVELLYIDGIKTGDKNLPTKAEPKIFSVDPRQIITYYSYDDDPKIKVAIKWDIISKLKYLVDVIYPDKIVRYERTRKSEIDIEWTLTQVAKYTNFFGEVPVIDYYIEEDAEGLIKPIVKYIDDLDTLLSGGIDEFQRFAESYLRVVGGVLDNPAVAKTANAIMETLRRLKRTRLFTGLKNKDDVSFLTKDIPAEYIRFIIELIIDQIHTHSHVPDFAKFDDLSGVAIQRLMFDFENVCAAAEANVDTGLIRRIELINKIYEKLNRPVVPTSKITISHKRNAPQNLKEFSEIAMNLKNAGMSRYLIADVFPDDIIPDVEEELRRQDEDREAMMPNIYETNIGDNNQDEIRGSGSGEADQA